MTASFRRALSCVMLLAAVAAPKTARAQDNNLDKKAAAKDHWQRGTSYYDLGRYQDAIKEFEAAYQLKNDPAFLYNLAQSYRLAGDAENALRLYRTYLRYVPKPANRAEIDDRIKTLEQQIAKGGSGTTPPPGGGTTPPPMGGGTAPPTPGNGTVPPPGGGTAPPPGNGTNPPPPGAGTDPNVDVIGTGAPPPGVTAPPVGGNPPPGFGVPPPPAPSGRGKTMQRAGMIIAGAGGVLLLVGIVEGLRARSASGQIEEDAAARRAFDPTVEKRGNSAETVEAVTVIAGLLAVGGGAALWYYGRKQSEVENTTSYRISLSPVLSPAGGGALLRVRF